MAEHYATKDDTCWCRPGFCPIDQGEDHLNRGFPTHIFTEHNTDGELVVVRREYANGDVEPPDA